MTAGVMSGGGPHGSGFHDVICLKNLFAAWREFRKGKRSKSDVAHFELRLEDNLFMLHRTLLSGAWKPEPYSKFLIHDPKLRTIHKAAVRDRVLYQAVYRVLYPIFDTAFVHDSYSSRDYKGVHRGVERVQGFIRRASRNYTQSAFILKCDIRKFFDSIDHEVLRGIIFRKIKDPRLQSLVRQILDSFQVQVTEGKGLPLGNVTSQLFANIYLNELDQFAKHALEARYYARYCDDFIIVHNSREYLTDCIGTLNTFCRELLRLELHPKKIFIRKVKQGVDFLGYAILEGRLVVRTSTKRRIFRKIGEIDRLCNKGEVTVEYAGASLQSYLGVLSHAKSRRIYHQIGNILRNDVLLSCLRKYAKLN